MRVLSATLTFLVGVIIFAGGLLTLDFRPLADTAPMVLVLGLCVAISGLVWLRRELSSERRSV